MGRRAPFTRLRNRLEEIDASSDRQAAQIESALTEADELLRLFNAMLRIARLEAGDTRRDMVSVDLSRLIECVVEAYRPAAEESARRLLCRIDASNPVLGDETLLSQLIANLVDNGLCHTPPGTTIIVETHPTPEGALLSVSDDGPGVPEPDLPNLTKRFYRVDDSRTKPGTGLGLTLVAAIVELHRARMKIKNRHPGLSIEIHFPVTPK